MGCTRTRATSLLVAITLLVAMLTPHLPVACSRHVVVLKADNGLNNNGDVYLAKDLSLASTDDESAMKRGFSGRKLAAPNEEEAAEAKGAATPAAAASRARTVRMRAAARHGDAAAEMYEMLRRDYAYRASRRRPINNGVPRQEEKP
ncbi:hypothetical protein ACP4OV_024350 [Aristida adscensionis]